MLSGAQDPSHTGPVVTLTALVWILLKANPETKTWMQVVYLGGDLRKQALGRKESKAKKKQKPTKSVILRWQLQTPEKYRDGRGSCWIFHLKDGNPKHLSRGAHHPLTESCPGNFNGLSLLWMQLRRPDRLLLCQQQPWGTKKKEA